MIDNDDLWAIFEAQEVPQRRMLKAVLEMASQQQQALLERVKRIFTAIWPTASPASAAEFVINSLSTRLPQFTVRLIVSKLDVAAYARFTNHTLPKKAPEVCFDDTDKTPKKPFGHNVSVFARRYTYLTTQRNGESLSDYIGMVTQRHEMAKLNAITPEQTKCLVWICGLYIPNDADIRTRALQKMQDNPQNNALGARSRDPAIPEHQTRRQTVEESAITASPKKLRQQDLNRGRTTNNGVVIAFTGADVAPINRIYEEVQISGATVQKRFDTGADVTLLSVRDWIKINCPKLLPHLLN
ncbi:unnamed protein product [Toxocara canis]|uniref:Peptidase A2 domain-containing protein n=1 Tax=Toxocara canis TaxID=6265 RepID=A0A183V2P1_TOXCA|nr:unnamed protein product [Toxocara canis]